ncbi:hypothetical protein [Streptomyces sp. NPDC001536]|uniref:hypothetical protein n=1 Tax=Streptomyces sp. NPDC001536 TaxID=3364583 RepID=UPI00369B25AB
MGKVTVAASDTALSAFSDNLSHVLEARALLCVITPDGLDGEAVVRAALTRHTGTDPVWVTAATSYGHGALLDAFYAELNLGARPRFLSDAQLAVDAELARRTAPVVVVRDAHRLSTDALVAVYGLWTHFQRHEPRMTVVLLGPERLRTVLQRPALASLHNCVYIWHRLTQ